MESTENFAGESKWKSALIESFVSRKAKIGVVGLGQVGLPLAIELAKAGFEVTGIDTDPIKVETIQTGRSYLTDVSSSVVTKHVHSGRLRATTRFDELSLMDTINICIPAGFSKTPASGASHIVHPINDIISNLRHGQLIIVENIAYPGTTEGVLVPAMQKAGFEIGKDIFLAYSPARCNPEMYKFKTREFPKIVGGLTADCTEVAVRFYDQFLQQVVPVSSPKAAEMIKLLENAFAKVSSAVVNEIAVLCHEIGVDIWEVVDAVKTNRSGSVTLCPEPGLGGDFFRADHAYFPWRTKVNGQGLKSIDFASQINSAMPEYIVSRITKLLNEHQKCLFGAKILLAGISNEKDEDEFPGCPALDVARLLLERGVDLLFYDPHIQHVTLGGKYFQRAGLDNSILQECEMIVILTDDSEIDYGRIIKQGKLIFDTRNAARKLNAPHLVRL